MKRRDISNYIDSLGQDKSYVKDLTPIQMHRIVIFLDKYILGVNDWRMFADTFKYTYQEIEMLRQSHRVKQATE